MTATPQYQAGNWIRCSVVFSPASGSVALADVTAFKLIVATPGTAATSTDVTAAATNISGGVLAGAVDPTTRAITATANCFYVDVFIPDATARQVWTIRWESNAPSPRITQEPPTLSFVTIPSVSPSP